MAAHSADRQSGGGEEGATILLFYLAYSAYINKQLGLIPKHKNADGGYSLPAAADLTAGFFRQPLKYRSVFGSSF